MIKKGFLLLVVIAVAGVGSFIYWYVGYLNQQTFAMVSINQAVFTVEIADSTREQEIGLSNRDFLEGNAGMLFLFPVKVYPPIWMKDTNIALDVLWIEGDKIVDITTDLQPQPGASDEEFKIYRSEFAANKVLELNAGTVERYKIEVGDKVVIK